MVIRFNRIRAIFNERNTVKVKEFLAMDNIAGKTIRVTEKNGSYYFTIPIRPDESFSCGGVPVRIYQSFLDAECEIVVTTVKDYINRWNPSVRYSHSIDCTGNNSYRLILSFKAFVIDIAADSWQHLEEDVCCAINKQMSCHRLEKSNLDFLK